MFSIKNIQILNLNLSSEDIMQIWNKIKEKKDKIINNILDKGSIIIKLRVNVDHVATLNSKVRENYPRPLDIAILAEKAGVDSITIH